MDQFETRLPAELQATWKLLELGNLRPSFIGGLLLGKLVPIATSQA